VRSLANAIKSNPNGAYALANDYDAAKDGSYPNCPIATTLNGTIQGLGNTISYLRIRTGKKTRGSASLLQIVASTGAVENLRLTDLDYKLLQGSSGEPAAGLVGQNTGYLFGDSVTGMITQDRGAATLEGGLVGTNSGRIVSSWADVTARAPSMYAAVAGFVGNNFGAIVLSYAEGDVSGYNAGGFVWENGGLIAEDFATGSVVGGYASGFASEIGSGGSIKNSYAKGSVKGSFAAGFVSQDEVEKYAAISLSYSTGKVPAGSGGFACNGYNEDFADDYWDTTTSGADYGGCGDKSISGVYGLTTQELESVLPPGFDKNIWAENPNVNNGFPYLIANPPPK
jgi:hypothetical protein